MANETPARTDKEGQPFVIRTLQPRDRDALTTMYLTFEPKRVAQGLPPADAAQIERWLDTVLATGHHLVVETGSAITGHGMLLPYAPRAAELANFLHQSIRDRGIGTELNRTLIELGRRQELSRIWLCVEPSNRRAIRSYEKVGFKRRPSTVWAPEVEMELDV